MKSPARTLIGPWIRIWLFVLFTATAPGVKALSMSLAQSGAEKTSLGRRVREVLFPHIVDPKTKSRMEELIPLKAGQALDREQVRQSIEKLHATGLFADIRAEVEAQADGAVSLSFVTTPNLFIGGVSAEGAPNRPTANQIANASKLQLGELFTTQKLEKGLRNIRQLMEQNGFYRAEISTDRQETPATQLTTVVFHIRPGTQARVGKVTVQGKPVFSVAQVQHFAKMDAGKPVSVQREGDALRRLRKKYQKQDRWLAQISVASELYRAETNTVDYVFFIDPGPTVGVSAEGFKISRGVLKKNVPIYEEDALDDDLLNEGRHNLLNYMQTRGYFEAKVDLKREATDSGRHVQVTYEIQPGEKHRVAKVTIVGNKYFNDDLLRVRMQVQPATRFFSYGRFNQSLLNQDVSGLEDLYRANGFQRIKISGAVIDNYEKTDQIAVKITVNEGPQTLVRAVNFVGNTAYTSEQLTPGISTAAGQLFSEFNISQDRDVLLNYYFNRGFPAATLEVSAKPVADQANRVDVTFSFHEGEQVFVERVAVSGLNYTKPFIVDRLLQVKAGDPLSQQEMLNTQQRLYDLGIFSLVDTAVQNPEGAGHEKTVLVRTEEAKRYTFTYGGGLEFQTGQPASNKAQGTTGVSPRVEFDVTRLNFRGRDHTITFKAHAGRLQQRGLISYDAPRWFNSADWRLTVTGFYDNTVDVTTFTSQRFEGSIQAQQTISKASTMVYRFTYRRVKASNIEVSQNTIPLLSQPVRVGAPGFSYIRDKRDNALETTRGNYTTVDGSVASSYFGSEADFSTLLAQNATYHAFGRSHVAGQKFVLARSLRIGIQNPFSNTITLQPSQLNTPTGFVPIPLAERFFSGGGNSDRGFGLNQAGPRDPQTGFPLGGSALLVNNIELRLPPVSLPWVDDNVSFAVFHDAGNVFTDGHDMLHNIFRWRQKNPAECLSPDKNVSVRCDYNYISHAVGVGLHYKTPIGPVRFDFGYNLNPPAYPSLSADGLTSQPNHVRHFNVYFSVGQTF